MKVILKDTTRQCTLRIKRKHIIDESKKKNEDNINRNQTDDNPNNTDGNTVEDPSTGVTPRTGTRNSPFNRSEDNLRTEMNTVAGNTPEQV